MNVGKINDIFKQIYKNFVYYFKVMCFFEVINFVQCCFCILNFFFKIQKKIVNNLGKKDLEGSKSYICLVFIFVRLIFIYFFIVKNQLFNNEGIKVIFFGIYML